MPPPPPLRPASVAPASRRPSTSPPAPSARRAALSRQDDALYAEVDRGFELLIAASNGKARAPEPLTTAPRAVPAPEPLKTDDTEATVVAAPLLNVLGPPNLPPPPVPPMRAPLPTASSAAASTRAPSLRVDVSAIPRPSPSKRPVPTLPAPPPRRGVPRKLPMLVRGLSTTHRRRSRTGRDDAPAHPGWAPTMPRHDPRRERLVATSWVSEADVDLTSPLAAVAPRANLYDSDTDLTRPLLPRVHAAFLPRPAAVPTFAGGPAPIRRKLVLPPPPLLERPPTAVVVSVPRRSMGVVEQSPSIQIRSTASAAEVPAAYTPRAPSAPEVPVVLGNFLPRVVEGNARHWLITLAAVVFGASESSASSCGPGTARSSSRCRARTVPPWGASPSAWTERSAARQVRATSRISCPARTSSAPQPPVSPRARAGRS